MVVGSDSAAAREDVADVRDCPGAMFVPADPALEDTSRSCATATGVKGHRYRVQYGWQAMKLTEYDVVLKSDLDVDLNPPESNGAKTRARWQQMLPQLTRAHRGVHSLAHADHAAPLNTGLVLLRPSKALYDEGIDVLRRCSFNKSHGWDLVGRPRSLNLQPRHLDGTPATDVGLGNDPTGNRAYARDDWEFVAAELDQGFMWFMLYIRSDSGRYLRYRANSHHNAIHYWFANKPWVISNVVSRTEEWRLKYECAAT